MTNQVGDLYRISARMRHPTAGDVVNVFHVRHNSSNVGNPTNAELNTAVLGYLEDIYAPMANAITNAQSPFDFKIDKVEMVSGKETVTEAISTYSWTMVAPPSNAGESLPPGAAAVVSLRSTRPKSFGRKFWGIFTEGTQAAGVLTSTVLSQITSAGYAILSGFTIANGSHVFGPIIMTALDAAGYLDLVESIATDIIGYQRRRRQGTGS